MLLSTNSISTVVFAGTGADWLSVGDPGAVLVGAGAELVGVLGGTTCVSGAGGEPHAEREINARPMINRVVFLFISNDS
jgi:hypothetical protein